MNRRSGISHQEGSALLAMAALPSVFLLEPSLTIARASTSAYFVKAGSGLFFFALMWWVSEMYRQRCTVLGGETSFLRFMEDCIGTVGARLVMGGWFLLLTAHLALMLRMVAESTAKTALQQSELLFPLVLFGGAMVLSARRPLSALLRASYILLVGVGGLLAVLIVLLLPMWEIELILPWQGFGYGHTLREIGLDMGTWCAGSVVLLLMPKMRGIETCRQSLAYGIGGVMLFKCGVILTALCVFGSVVGAERSFLFYEMAKLVHFSQYIQRVEAVFICAWLMVVFLGMTLLVRASVHLAAELLPVDDARPLSALFIALVAVMAALMKDLAFVAEQTERLGYTAAPLFFAAAVGALSIGFYRRIRRK